MKKSAEFYLIPRKNNENPLKIVVLINKSQPSSDKYYKVIVIFNRGSNDIQY